MTAISGGFWAMVPVAVILNQDVQQPLVLMMFAGLTAGAGVQAASYALVAHVFAVPVIMATIVSLILQGGQSNLVTAFGCVFYLFYLIRSAVKAEEGFSRTVILKIEATLLAASLERERAAAAITTKRLHQLANHDVLTGAGNRAAFSNELKSWLDDTRQTAGHFFLFLLDLDHFKSINDTLGHTAGDNVLKKVAKRISSGLDGKHFVARLGGDEFAIIAATDPNDPTGRLIADQLMRKACGKLRIGEHVVTIGASIGIAQFPDDGETAEDLLAHADLALYAAKDAGRYRWRRFDAGLLASATTARDLERDLPSAMADGSLQVWFQPQIALSDHRLTGLESLIRWEHPVHGWIAPPRIVAAALRTRTSEALTGFILDHACRQILRLHVLGLDTVVVAVNVSPSELDHYDLSDLISRSIETHGIDAAKLEIEITEEAFAASKTILAVMKDLTKKGIHLAIDDFGTGYSSIAYLSQMHVNRIKIDRSFVMGFADRPGDRILVQAILGIGQSFGIDVVAEGVETAEEAVLLQSLGCHVVQGYFFGYPMTSAALQTWIAERSDPQQVSPHRLAAG